MRASRVVVAWVAVRALAGCAEAGPPGDVGLVGLVLRQVEPAVIVPGSELRVEGASFVPTEWGDTALRLRTAGEGGHEVVVAARFVDYDHLVAAVDADDIAALGDDGARVAEVRVEITSAEDGAVYRSPPLPVSLGVRRQLVPSPRSIEVGALAFVNDPVEVVGEGLLLGGPEGVTVAVVRGCVATGDGPCVAVGPVDVPLAPADRARRDRGHFPFAPAIAGIEPGAFAGDVVLENRHADGTVTRAPAVPLRCDLSLPAVFRLSPTAASLGQYVVVDGGGFVGGEPGAATELHLAGRFTRAGGDSAPVDLVLIPEVVDGRTARYVVSEDDALGGAIDLRSDAGVFAGTVQPTITWRGARVRGDAVGASIAIAPVKQVVYLDFRPSYVEALRRFGLRAVDHEIRRRAVDGVRAAYDGVGLEVRTEVPTDFALYAHVEIAGDDPNAMGLLGYDNSPGKDSGNLRLDDRLGGVNAQTQEDGYPGYGGVFIASLMGFSQHPAVGDSSPGADPLFDRIFDPLRPDRGDAVVAVDLRGFVAPSSGASCPAAGRAEAIGCAVWSMGSLIGTTVAHEVGHSLGLANPYDQGFHHGSDGPDRLMDAGGDRPFRERAELMGQGPGRFCDAEYDYLQAILPGPPGAGGDPALRPRCD